MGEAETPGPQENQEKKEEKKAAEVAAADEPAAPAARPSAGATPAAKPAAATAAAKPAVAGGAASAGGTATAVAEPPGPPKVKVRKPKQRACDEKDAKGKVCCGHLKRWYDYPAEIEALVGKKAEIYRCENCKTLYKPDLSEMPRSYTQRY